MVSNAEKYLYSCEYLPESINSLKEVFNIINQINNKIVMSDGIDKENNETVDLILFNLSSEEV